MILYYSGATNPNTDQTIPEKSLGGYISSTIINNGMLNSLFSTISKSTVQKNSRDTRLIVLTNTTGGIAYNVRIYIDNTLADTHSDIVMAAVAPAIDNCGNSYFEQISSPEALPYQAQLSAHNGAGNEINVGNINNGDSIGIWLSRTIIANDFPMANGATNGISPQAITALQDAIANPVTLDESNLVVLWDNASTTTTTSTTSTTTTTTT